MPLVEQEVKTVRQHYLCDECDEGEMECQHGITTLETTWLHKCNHCGAERWFEDRYPRTVTRRVSEVENDKLDGDV